VSDFSGLVSKVGGGANALQLVSEYVAHRKCTEEQLTERIRIISERDIALRALENEREIILEYFSKRFSERWGALDECFAVLNRAVTDKNDRALDAALAGILNIIGDNPLSDFDTFRRFRLTDEIIEV
jgi:hypothetical protein